MPLARLRAAGPARDVGLQRALAAIAKTLSQCDLAALQAGPGD